MKGLGDSAIVRTLVVLATPTTVRGSNPETLIVLPKGSSPGQNRSAMTWLIMATGAPSSLSPPSNARPRRMRIPEASKNCGSTDVKSTR